MLVNKVPQKPEPDLTQSIEPEMRGQSWARA